ncbi:MAG: glycosyltransferase family 39 protein [Mariprofundus sp.]|nr:glycosyltransferase family 39 protein [Mariprofundus sp.]
MPFSFQPSLQLYKILTLLAAACMLLPLPIMQYVGEEGLMALKSYEMFVRDDWLRPSILGGIWPHSPLWHWPVIIISKLIGWEHVDFAVRFVSVMATWSGAYCAAMTARWLYGNSYGNSHAHVAWLAALVYLSMGEIAFWYGWLGYVDATFGFFIFAAITSLWRAISDESAKWFILSLLFISLAFLTKNITAYALFGASGFILLWQLKRWHLLKTAWFVPFGLLALTVPVLWQSFVITSGSTATVSINDVLRNFIGFGILDYLKHWFTYPFIFLFRALPVSIILMWLWLTRKHHFSLDKHLSILALLLLVCFLPFWISASASPRYLVPLYGLVALFLTGLMLQLKAQHLRQTVMLIALVVLLKIPYSLLILPYIKDWRPERDVKAVSTEIMQLTDNAPLRTRNDVASGLAIAAYINVWRQQRAPIHWYNGQETGVYILAEVETPNLGQLIKTWRLRGNIVYLYWQEPAQ